MEDNFAVKIVKMIICKK